MITHGARVKLHGLTAALQDSIRDGGELADQSPMALLFMTQEECSLNLDGANRIRPSNAGILVLVLDVGG